MTRKIIAIVIGVLIAVGIISLCEYITGKIFPFPPEIQYKDKETIRAFMENASVINYLMILFGYILGCFGGGFVASLINGKEHFQPAIIVGAILLVSGIMNIFQLPGQPSWFIITCLIIYIPSSFVGFIIAKRI